MSEIASSRFPWPPVIFGSALVCGLMLHGLWPLVLPSATPALALQIAGMLVALIGIALLVMASGRFRAAGTPMAPIRPSTALVTDGVYGFTRNPIYLGMSCVLAGIGLALRDVWFLPLVTLAVFAVSSLAISREELYLEAKFGEAYRLYRARVRRWL